MEKTIYIKWFLELLNQEYKGNIRLLNSNINQYQQLEPITRGN